MKIQSSSGSHHVQHIGATATKMFYPPLVYHESEEENQHSYGQQEQSVPSDYYTHDKQHHEQADDIDYRSASEHSIVSITQKPKAAQAHIEPYNYHAHPLPTSAGAELIKGSSKRHVSLTPQTNTKNRNLRKKKVKESASVKADVSSMVENVNV